MKFKKFNSVFRKLISAAGGVLPALITSVFRPPAPRHFMLPSKRIVHSFVGLLVLISLLSNVQSDAKASSPGKDGALTVTTANTIVNTYTSLAANAAVGSTSLSVTSAAALGVAPGDLILIIQMQGAGIDTSVNTAAWGAVTNYNNAGNYEFATVYSVSGNTINLAPCGPALQHSYTASGHAQVIRVPQYSILTINSGASITAPAWNGTTGGVAAVNAQNTVTINGSIDVTGTGFRGGVRDNLTTNPVANVTGYAFTTAATGANFSAQKGESIAGFTADYDTLGGTFPGGYGRGAPANGGGGGNAHNAGGGGGANGYSGIAWNNGQGNPDTNNANWITAWNLDPTLNSATTSSGGGRGGYTYAAAQNNPTTTAPGNALWGGDHRQERGGLGGRPLINLPVGSNTSNRIFFGGGGGAGDGNNDASADGAPGGGIVFVLAPTVNGTGTIAANGQNGSNTVAGGNDAPGGGGGGGSVVVSTTTLSGIAINAKGGKGGNQLIATNESEGPGGGGGGGVVATSGGAVPIFVSGAASGTTNSAGVNPLFTLNGATAGAAGNTSSAVPSVPNKACIGIAKTVTNVTAVAGPAYDVQLVVRAVNMGSEQLTNVQVTDDLNSVFSAIPGTTYSVTAAPVVTFSPGGGTIAGNNAFNGNADKNLLNPGTLNNGSTALITFTVRVSPPGGPGPFNYNNVANGSGTGGVTSGNTTDASQTGTNPDPDGDGNPGNNSTPTLISLTPVIPTIGKVFAPNPVNPGVASTLTITLTNPSGAPLTSAAITDNLPSGLTTVATTAATTCAGGTASQTTTSVSLSGGTIPAAGNCTLSVQVVGASGGAYVNTIPAGALTTSGGTNTAPASSTLNVNNASPVTVAKSFNPASIAVGGVSQLTILISNPNSVAAALNNPGLTDTYPAGVTNAPTPAAATTCGGAVTAAAGGNTVVLGAGNSIPANGSCTVTVNVTSATAGPAVTNTIAAGAVLTTNLAFRNTNTATATLTVSLLPPTVSKSFAPANIAVGGTSTLQFVVTNPNSSNLIGIAFTDVLPAGLTATNGTTNNVCGGSGTLVISGGNTLTVTGIAINGVSGGASCTFNVTVTGASAGVKNNTTGGVSSTQTGIGAPSNTANLTVLGAPTIAKAFSPATITSGGTSTITFTLTNPNTSALSNASFTDTLTNMAISGNQSAGGTCTGAGTNSFTSGNTSLSFSGISIPASSSCTVTILVTSSTLGVNPNSTSGVTTTEVPTAGSGSNTANLTVNAQPGTINGTSFNDANTNGIQDAGESGINNVTVKIYDSTGTTLIATTTTDASGHYSVSNLPAGNYMVVEQDPSGYVSSTPNTVSVSVPSNGTAQANFGDYRISGARTNSISGVVFDDANSNGLFDSGEQVIPSVTITLYDQNNNVVAAITTAANGSYSFNNLPAGVYTVVETNLSGYVSTTLDHVSVVISSGTTAVVNYGDKKTSATIIDPAVTKYGDPSSAKVGDLVIYTITVGNNGNTDALNVVLTDTKPSFLDIINITVSPDKGFPVTISGNTFTINFGTVTPTDFYTVTVLTRVNSLGQAPGGTNNASITTTSPNDPVFNDSASATLTIPSSSSGSSGGTKVSSLLPRTGFAPGVITSIAPAPVNIYDTSSDLTIEIPALGIKTSIVGVPQSGDSWDVTWLGNQVGYLNGTAFPTWSGNSVLTGHVYGTSGLPGPFINLHTLKWGDQIIIHFAGQRYIYQVRENTTVSPTDTSVFKHQNQPWITLITCKDYNASTNTYAHRVAVGAVLVQVVSDTSSGGTGR